MNRFFLVVGLLGVACGGEPFLPVPELETDAATVEGDGGAPAPESDSGVVVTSKPVGAPKPVPSSEPASDDVETTEQGDAGTVEQTTSEGQETGTEEPPAPPTTEEPAPSTEPEQTSAPETSAPPATSTTTEPAPSSDEPPPPSIDPLITDGEPEGGVNPDSFRNWFTYSSRRADASRIELDPVASGGYAAHGSIDGVAQDSLALVGYYFNGRNGYPEPAAAEFDGVAFWVCGSGTFWFEVPTVETLAVENALGQHNHFAKEISLSGSWQLLTVRWSDLSQGTPTHTFDASTVRGLFWTVVNRDLDVWVDNLQFWSHGLPLLGDVPTGGC